ncbi:MAG: hypothetical protein FJ279_00435 [Planctomycetes bacterium]|nr:hypothetical protein [Planctomycetota bacterium]
MALNVPASQGYLKTLTCAYTGKPVTVLAVSHGDRPPLYFSPDAFDPSEFHKTPEDLFAHLGTRNGVRNAARNGRELVCPYTGAEMAIDHVKEFGFRTLGGFCPSEPQADPIAFARAMLSRGGKVPKSAPRYAPPPRGKLHAESEPPAPAPGLSDAALAGAERTLRPLASPRTTVTVQGLKGSGAD